MTHPPSPLPRLLSTLSGDPEMGELVEWFVEELPGRISSLSDAMRAHDLARLRTLAHQLKGAAGGYGFDQIGRAAGVVERCVDGGSPDRALADALDELVSLCRRAARVAASDLG
jgi:HPt (histidine-containing phosphotransfer) domain-containing protein